MAFKKSDLYSSLWAIQGAPCVADGVLYVATEKSPYAIGEW